MRATNGRPYIKASTACGGGFKIDKEIKMIIVKRQIQLHHAVSVIGGFWGGYTIFNHLDIFANAQTGNLIKLVLSVCSFQLDAVLYMLSYFGLYILGNAFYAVARQKLGVSMKIVSFIVSALAIVMVGVLNFTNNSFLAVMPIFFAAPVQWNAFKTAGGNSSSTIFSSNNVRQAVIKLTQHFMNKDKKSLRNARFYWATLMFFHIGVAASCLLSLALGAQSIWFCFVPLGIAVVFYYRYEEAKINAFK